ncbi:MAG: threonylcarbamoyl-AMP synthase [Nanoarchaeota archaeon]|nr:threonylcarbamoyl-AMP synthase [Nanoarchaeota archaeon]
MNDAIKKASKILKEGGIVIYPTDTVYGLGCNAFNRKTIERIRNLKGRTNKPFSVAVADIEGVHSVAKVNEWQEETLLKNLPGAYTFVLEKKSFVPDSVSKKGIGVRIPDHEHCLTLLESVEFPVITTSANISGQKPARSVKEIPKEILDKVDFVVDAGELGGKSSAVVDLKKNTWKVLRA